MKVNWKKSFLFAALCLNIFASIALADERMGVYVDGFRVGTSEIPDPRVAVAITEMFTTQLANSPAFRVVERSRLQSIAREHRISQSGLADPATMLKVGRIAGVKWLLTGSITEYVNKQTAFGIPLGGKSRDGALMFGSSEGKVTIDIRTVNVETSEIKNAFSVTGAASSSSFGAEYRGYAVGDFTVPAVVDAAIRQAVKKAVKDLERRIGGLQYRIVKVNPDTAIIDSGSSRGVEKGQLFAVYSEGDVLRDYRGNIIGTENIYYALLKVSDVKADYSICTYVKGKGGPSMCRGGDLLEPIERAQAKTLPVVKHRKMKTTEILESMEPSLSTSPDTSRLVSSERPTVRRQNAPAPITPPAVPLVAPAPSVDVNVCTDEKLIESYQISERERDNVRGIYQTGMEYYKDKKYKEAYKQFLLGAMDSDYDVLNTYWAGMSAQRMGSQKSARRHFEAALKLNPDYQPAKKALKSLK